MSEQTMDFGPLIQIRYHEALKQPWLYVEAGHDPRDKAPLTMARPLTPIEAVYWKNGQASDLADILLRQGVPVHYKKPSKIRRWLRSIMGK